MSLEKFILATPSAIVLKCDEDSEAVKMKLTEICEEEEAGIKKHQSKDGVTIGENVGFLQSLYKPRLEGKLEEKEEDGQGTRLTLVARPSPLISYFVEQSGSAVAAKRERIRMVFKGREIKGENRKRRFRSGSRLSARACDRVR